MNFKIFKTGAVKTN